MYIHFLEYKGFFPWKKKVSSYAGKDMDEAKKIHKLLYCLIQCLSQGNGFIPSVIR